MRWLFSSPRRRRRLAWGAAVILVVGAITALAVVLPGGRAKSAEEPLRAVAPEPPPPRRVPFTPDTRRAAVAAAKVFVRSAVKRENLDDSWAVASPRLRSGLTKADWRTGNIPVVPFPVESARWRLEHSFADTVDMRVLLLPERAAKTQPMVFDIELRAYGKGKKKRWLVESWTPVVTPESRPIGSPASRGPVGLQVGNIAQPGGESRLGGAWLLLPFGILGALLLVPVAFGLNHWRRSAKAMRLYRSDAGR